MEQNQNIISENFVKFEKFLLEKFPNISEEQIQQFQALEALYKEWNAKINVISRKDIDNIYEHHIVHSIAIAGYLHEYEKETFNEFSILNSAKGESQKENKILDLGTGGGFPGIPLAILFPNVHFTLCDSIGKKTKVAEAVAKAIGLQNVTIENKRAEKLKDKFDFVVSRAVTNLPAFYPWVRGKFTKGILYLKGGDIAPEISELIEKYKLNGSFIHIWNVEDWTKNEYFKEKFVVHIEKKAVNQ